MTRLREVLVVLATSLLFGGWALSQSFVGPYLKLGVQDEASFNDAGAYLQGALVYGSDAGKVYFNNGSGWTALGTGSGGSSASFFFDAGSGFMATTTPLTTGVPDGGPAFLIGDPLVPTQGFLFFPTTNVGGPTNRLKTSYNNFGYLPRYNNTLEVRASDLWVHAGDPGGTGVVGYGAGTQALSVLQEYDAIGSGLTVLSGGPTVRGSLFWAPQWFGRSNQGLALESYYNDPILFQVNSGQNIAESHMMRLTSAGALESYQSSGGNSFANLTNGARFDLGTGSNDYLYSDGTGIQTPSYVQSSQTLSSGAGLLAYAVKLVGSVASAFTSAAASALGDGALAYDSDTAQVQVVTGGQFAQAGRPQYQRQGWSTSIPYAPHLSDGGIVLGIDGGAQFTAPYINGTVWVEKSNPGTADGTYILETVNSTARSSVTLGGYTYFPLTTEASEAANASEIQLTNKGGGAQSIIPTDGSPSMCAAVRTNSDVSSSIYIVGLIDAANLGSGGIASDTHVWFLYNSATSPNWQTCTFDTSEHCTTTSVPVATSTRYSLCLNVNSARGYKAFINGNYVSGTNAYPLTSGLGMAPFLYVETGVASARTLYAGPYEVTYW